MLTKTGAGPITAQFPGVGEFAFMCHGRLDTIADVVVDLETLGRARGAQVLEIGAACLSPSPGVGLQGFAGFPSLVDQARKGLTAEPSTVLWWLDESEAGPGSAARQRVTNAHGPNGLSAYSAVVVLADFTRWLQFVSHGRELRIWGNGATFDLGILAGLYEALGMEVPWNFWDERDLRTLFDVNGGKPRIPLQGTFIKHSGLFDAYLELAQLHITLSTPESHHER